MAEIKTRYRGPVGLAGSRIIARGLGRSASVPYDHAATDPHIIAADALAKRLGYGGVEYVGTMPLGNVYRTIDRAPVAPWDADETGRLRRQAGELLTRHDHSWSFTSPDDRRMTRENCGACVLNGYGDREEPGTVAPNYAGWARIYVQSGRTIPKKYAKAFQAERDDTSSPHYVEALERDIATFGLHEA